MADMSGESAGSRPAAEPVVRRPSRSEGDLLASGSIEAEEVTLAAELGGRIVETAAAEGDIVAEGDPLLRLDQAWPPPRPNWIGRWLAQPGMNSPPPKRLCCPPKAPSPLPKRL